MFSAFCFADVLENTTTIYLSWQQLEKELCKVLEERYGGTEQLLKKLFPQRRVHQLIFKYETLMRRRLSLEEWRKLFKGLDMEEEFLDIVQKFKIGKNPRNIKTRKVWKVCKSHMYMYYHYNVARISFFHNNPFAPGNFATRFAKFLKANYHYHVARISFFHKNPFAPGNLSEKHVSKLGKCFSGHCHAIILRAKTYHKLLTVCGLLILQMQNISLHSGIGLKDLFTCCTS